MFVKQTGSRFGKERRYLGQRFTDRLTQLASKFAGKKIFTLNHLALRAGAIEKLFEDTEDDEDADLIPATPDVKNFSYTVVDGDIYYRQNSIMEKQKPNKTAEKRIKALVKVREALREVLNNQLEDMPDEIIANSQRKLNIIYDKFVNEYGYINSKANMKAFEKDNSINLLASLEKFDSEKNYKGKSDIFSKRTIRPHKAVDKVTHIFRLGKDFDIVVQ